MTRIYAREHQSFGKGLVSLADHSAQHAYNAADSGQERSGVHLEANSPVLGEPDCSQASNSRWRSQTNAERVPNLRSTAIRRR